MRYIDAGYASALGVLAAYAVLLVVRRARLERLAGARRTERRGDGLPPPR